jgi:hypothetical protein
MRPWRQKLVPGGRPTKLTPAVTAEIAAELEGGATLAEAASAAGVSVRTLRAWRERAWSRLPEDRPHVQLERRVQEALGRRASRMAPEPWQVIAARIEADELFWAAVADPIDIDA